MGFVYPVLVWKLTVVYSPEWSMRIFSLKEGDVPVSGSLCPLSCSLILTVLSVERLVQFIFIVFKDEFLRMMINSIRSYL